MWLVTPIFIWKKLLSINYLIEATINFAQMQYPQPDKSNKVSFNKLTFFYEKKLLLIVFL